MTSLRLEDHGLAWEHAPAVLGHPFGDGPVGAAAPRPGPDRLRPRRPPRRRRRAPGWTCAAPGTASAAPLVDALTSPFPPRARRRPAAARARAGRRPRHRPAAGHARRRRSAASSSADRPRGCCSPATPVTPTSRSRRPGSGVFGVLMTMLGQTVGFPVPRGGAQALTDALVARFTSLGGRLETDAPVTRVVVRDGAVTGVVTRDGEAYDAPCGRRRRRRPAPLRRARATRTTCPPRVVRGMRDFELDPGTVKVDWALTGPVPWAGAPGRSARHGARRGLGRGDDADACRRSRRAWCPTGRSC